MTAALRVALAFLGIMLLVAGGVLFWSGRGTPIVALYGALSVTVGAGAVMVAVLGKARR